MNEQIPDLIDAAEHEYFDMRLDKLPEPLRRRSLDYYYLSVVPGLGGMTDQGVEAEIPYLETTEDIYVHTPYCSGVCDFCSYFLKPVGKRTSPIEDYYESVLDEVEYHAQRTDLNIRSFFFGGGTPSLIPEHTLNRFFEHLNQGGYRKDSSFGTMELHPEFFDDLERASRFLSILKLNGVNRVSIGYQSSEEEVLNESNRRHGADFLRESIDFLRERDMLVNIDLMYGLSNLSNESWGQTLIDAINTHPDSISTYFLFVTPGTVTYQEVMRGLVKLPDHQQIQTQHIMAQNILAKYGYYELPNDFYAYIPGADDEVGSFRQEALPSESNSLPIGAGGYGFRGSTQFYNVFSHKDYAKRTREGLSPVWRARSMNDDELFARDIMFSLKNSPNIDMGLFDARYGMTPLQKFEKIFEKLGKIGLIEHDDRLIRATKAGRLVVEEMAMLFMPPSLLSPESEIIDSVSTKRKVAKHHFLPAYRGEI